MTWFWVSLITNITIRDIIAELGTLGAGAELGGITLGVVGGGGGVEEEGGRSVGDEHWWVNQSFNQIFLFSVNY
jgi:hypothetical protein